MGPLRHTFCRCGLPLAVATFLLQPAGVAFGQKDETPPSVAPRENVHSAFVLNLAKFVRWPADAFDDSASPLVIGTFVRDPINDIIDRDAQKTTVEGRAVRTVRLRSLADLDQCHVIYLSRGLSSQIPGALSYIHRKPILAISDAEGFLELGGHVAFVLRGSQTRFQINTEALRTSSLDARSQLLRLAERYP